MRITRKRKYKKLYNGVTSVQIFVILYVSLINASIITTTTEAQFNKSITTQNFIQAGHWYDGSILSFIDKPTQNIKACAPMEINVRLKNTGFSMLDSTTYEVYYSNNANGNPKQTGSKIAEGVLNPLSQNEIGSLNFTAEKDGAYMFKLFQRPEFKESGNVNSIEWSEKVIINCIAAKEEEELEEKSTEEVESEQSDDKVDSNISKEAENEKDDESTKDVEQKEMNKSPDVKDEQKDGKEDVKSTEEAKKEEDSAEEIESDTNTDETENNPKDSEEVPPSNEPDTENQDQSN
ncbi:hypothetical protein AB685_07580 [Bacillus sp. LL01]|uniref:amyloid fiber anchoring/assembly protein TapA n=1 Tax=Bacillus sp. LL01 TaxID=1665556 RepID=UPI00064D4E82|nr:amyloid fiber anchoring/assembly protein TapA [Bacillus sp. LL01]KMJ58927.1 hypothetical protein AB685_07580 [Bacillus sp. LL01]